MTHSENTEPESHSIFSTCTNTSEQREKYLGLVQVFLSSSYRLLIRNSICSLISVS